MAFRGIQMAEYNMSYEEIKEFIDHALCQSKYSDSSKQYRAEILAALTAKDEPEDTEETVTETIELWENQIGTPSELLLGTRYIVIKDSLLSFVRTAITSGLLDAIIIAYSNPEKPMSGVTISVAANIVYGLIEVFKEAAVLEDCDFCVYMQAVTHFKSHKEFTLKDMHDWFPHGDNTRCNMINSKWDCKYLDENGTCKILEEKELSIALESLERKKILRVERRANDKFYVFRW